MIWSRKCVLKFIEAYKQKKVLWDPSHKNYYSRILKQKAWEEISGKMQCNIDELKRKMNYLLAARRREKAKITKIRATEEGTEEVYQSSWFAFKHMEFLTERNKYNNIIKTEENDSTSKNLTPKTDEIRQNNHCEHDKRPATLRTESNNETNHNNAIDSSTIKSPILVERIQLPQEPILQSTFNLQETSASAAVTAVPDSTVNVTGLDQYQLYANYLAGKFRGYSKQTFIEIEHQINNLLYNADCGRYDSAQESTSDSLVDTVRPQTPLILKNMFHLI